MQEAWTIAMLISGALFSGGIVPIAWERAPAWRAADGAAFRVDFADTLRRLDRLQPASCPSSACSPTRDRPCPPQTSTGSAPDGSAAT